MQITVIGGTGHIGSYLVPRLILAGHDVTVIARHAQPQYTDARLAWPKVKWVVADRLQEEKAGAWDPRMRAIQTEILVDLICYTPQQMKTMHEAFADRVRHFLHCGTIWAYGAPDRLPYDESFPRRPISEYGKRKAQIEAFLHEEFQRRGFPATIIHPGHISGRCWLPIDPQGSHDGVGIYQKLARGEPVPLPEFGRPLLHHVHGDDVAQLFQLAIERREQALGESFSAVAPYALSLLGCCRAVAALFNKEPNLEFVSWEDLAKRVSPQSYQIIRSHADHSSCAGIAKAQRLLGYHPRYTTEQIYAESIEHLLETKHLEI